MHSGLVRPEHLAQQGVLPFLFMYKSLYPSTDSPDQPLVNGITQAHRICYVGRQKPTNHTDLISCSLFFILRRTGERAHRSQQTHLNTEGTAAPRFGSRDLSPSSSLPRLLYPLLNKHPRAHFLFTCRAVATRKDTVQNLFPSPRSCVRSQLHLGTVAFLCVVCADTEAGD